MHRQELTRWSVRLALLATLLGTVLLRLLNANQPIVENYVGRQVPTAMVARNLDRRSGFLWPQLDTAPFPNYFLVEPPLYELAVVGLRRIAGWKLDACGRIVSAFATALGVWGLFGLIGRREGCRVALAAAIAFCLFPVTIRYGRAFQPDALMLGATLGGLSCWDRAEDGSGWFRRIVGWLLLAVGFAAKVTAALVLVPLWVAIPRPRSRVFFVLATTALLPALLWYVWANHLIESTAGSRSSAENRAIWTTVVGLSAFGKLETWANLWRFLVVRAFTPPALALGLWGLSLRPANLSGNSLAYDLWKIWAVVALLMLAMLAGKLHHEYYWLILAPAVAAGIGRGWTLVAERHRGLGWGLALLFFLCSGLLSRSTWQTPPEWEHLEVAARQIQEIVPPEAWLAAPEPLLYQADRRGCRLEFTPRAAARAAEEWPGIDGNAVDGPLALIDCYGAVGARFVADVVTDREGESRKALHEAIRRRYKVRLDNSSVIIAEINPSETSGHGQ